MITKENLIGAYFIDNDRKNIEVLTTSEDKKQIIPTIMPFDENNASFKERRNSYCFILSCAASFLSYLF